jgi:VWFA-related protein
VRQLCGSAVIVVLAIGWASWDVAGAQPSNRLLVLLVDDLHFDFRSTPRMRDMLVRRILPLLFRGDDSVSLLTTGYSSVAIAPTTDREAVLAGIRQIVGSALRADDILAPMSADERLRRAIVAIATARDVIQAIASITARRKTLIYVSSGYGDERVASDLSELVAAANRANVTIHALDALGLAGGPAPAPSATNSAAWLTYSRDAYDSLHRLADATGGRMVSTPGELDAAIEQVAR